jgi:hypothetical protein
MIGAVALTKTSPGNPFLSKMRMFAQRLWAAANGARSSISSEVASLEEELSSVLTGNKLKQLIKR